VDGDLLSYSIVAGPSHGTLSGTPPQVTYTLLSVTMVLTVLLSKVMMVGGFDVATVSVSINPVNDVPVAMNDSYSTRRILF